MFDSLASRVLEPELMDDPALDADEHHRALRALDRINRISFTAASLWRGIKPLAQTGRTLHVIDVACGGGDVALSLWRLARQAGVELRITGIDVSPTAVALANQRSRDARAQDAVRFIQHDMLAGDLPITGDVVICCLFLHHLTDAQNVTVLSRLARAATRRVLVSDLLRSRRGLVMTFLGTRLLTRSRIVHVDGVRSVRAAYRIPEVLSLCRQAGMTSTQARCVWPMRFELSWDRT